MYDSTIYKVQDSSKFTLWKIILAILVLMPIFFLTGCESESVDTMSLNLQTWVGHGPIYLALEKGFFADEKILVDIIEDENVKNRNFALKEGLLDAEGSSIDLLIHKRNENVPVVAVLKIDASRGADGIISDKSIRKISDLQGKKVALERKNVGEAFLAYLLAKNNLSWDGIFVVPVGGSEEAAQALIDKEVDAAVTWEPWLSIFDGANNDQGHLLISTAEEPGVIVDILVIREEYIKNNPEAVRKFTRAWFKSLDYINKNYDESMEIMAKFYGMDTAEYKLSIEGLEWPSYEDNLNDLKTNGSMHDVYEKLTEIFFETGVISNKVESTSAIDGSLLNNLYQES